MKAMIVDDEKHVRDAIRLLLDWHSFGIDQVLEASDGQSAVEMMVQEQPEIVFTDMMMPGILGTDLLAWITQNAPRTKTIVISGHNDFDFVRSTMRHGGLDYILKPIDPDQLQEAVRKAVDLRLREDAEVEEESKRNIVINEIKPAYWDKLFSQMLEDPSCYYPAADNITHEFGLSQKPASCRVALLDVRTSDSLVKRKFSTHTDLLFFSLSNICNEYLHRGKEGFAFRHWNSVSELAVLFWGDPASHLELLSRINEGIQRSLGGKFVFGIGTIKPFPTGMPDSYRQAKTAIAHRNLLESGACLFPYAERMETVRTMAHFSGFEQDIRLAVLSGREEGIREAIETCFTEMRSLSHIDMEYLEQWRSQYAIARAKWQQEWFPKGDTDTVIDGMQTALPFDSEGKLRLDLWQRIVTESLVELSRKLQVRRLRERSVIQEIGDYLRNNYQQDIVLQDIADRFFLSREYISRKFKQEFRENLSDYVARIRIEKAKLLLANPSMRIGQIAAMVGYPDDKYFSRVFKKIEGISPNDYRKTLL
jgi:two-component system response regulator YesN